MADSSPDDEIQIEIVFEYIIQRVPTRTKRAVLNNQSGTIVYLKLKRKNLDANGYPDPRALWYAENMFLKELKNKHLPDVRVVHWQCHLKGQTKLLSEYRVLLPADHH